MHKSTNESKLKLIKTNQNSQAQTQQSAQNTCMQPTNEQSLKTYKIHKYKHTYQFRNQTLSKQTKPLRKQQTLT